MGLIITIGAVLCVLLNPAGTGHMLLLFLAACMTAQLWWWMILRRDHRCGGNGDKSPIKLADTAYGVVCVIGMVCPITIPVLFIIGLVLAFK